MTATPDSPFRIKDLLGEVGTRLGFHSAVETGRVWSQWRDIVGGAVAEHAEPSSLKAGVLRVRADSPAWATEIGYLRDEIKSAVNRVVGVDLVKEVKVWTGPGGPRRGAAKQGSAATPASSDGDLGVPRGPTASVPADPQSAAERAHAAWLRRETRRS
jgi:predicted nucleic acid-binding Zn ribbon protein